jgi:hypothetical protein
MSGLDELYKLDPVSPTSNSNYASANVAENGPPSAINNALRALGSMVARAVCYRSADLSASVSTNIAAASTGVYQVITGAGNIASFGTVPGEQPSAAVVRILVYASGSSVSVSHSSGKITLLGSQSRDMRVGDVQGLIHEGSSDGWREFLFHRADGTQIAASLSATTLTAGSISASAVSTVTLRAASASVTAIGFTSLQATSISASVGAFGILKIAGSEISTAVAQVVRDSDATYTTITTDMPYDDSIPQNTEGDEILSVAITPTNANSTLRIRAVIPHGASIEAAAMQCAIFVDTTAGAIAATSSNTGNSSSMATLVLEHTLTAGSTSARTYKVRCGPEAGGSTMYINGDAAGRKLGGVMKATLEVEEILP